MLDIRDFNLRAKYKLIYDIVKYLWWELLISHPNNFDICLKNINSIRRGTNKNQLGGGAKISFNWGGGLVPNLIWGASGII